MAATAPADGSEDVADFLRRIKELGEKRDQEDAERTRKLEEDIAEARRQRAVRRAGMLHVYAVLFHIMLMPTPERERSLSPEKSSPSGTPTALRTRRGLSRSDTSTPVLSPSTKPSLVPDVQKDQETDNARPLAKSEPQTSLRDDFDARPPQPPRQVPNSSTLPTRSGTLSWQQRPGSVRGARIRPTSMLDRASPLQASEPPTGAGANTDAAISRDTISKNLSAKDPSWFRQTSDRGLGSPALRKTSDTHKPSNEQYGNRQALHGMSQEAKPNPALPNTGTKKEDSISETLASLTAREQMPPPRASKMAEDQVETSLPTNSPSQSSGSPSTTLPSFDDSKDFSSDTMKPYGSSNRPTFERPASPTKGMGGFVQSAMLKRSDSVTKRWSAQPISRLNRQNSNARERAAESALPSSTSMPKLGENNVEASFEADSRPGSKDEKDLPTRQDSISRGSTRQHFRSESRNGFRDQSPSKIDDPQAPPSPSKRWSPVKSSWLESALSKPESPQPTTKQATNQPSWMVELNRARPQRGSRDLDLSSDHNTAPKQKPLVSKASVDLKLPPTKESTAPTRVILPSSLFRAGDLTKSSHSAALSGSAVPREKPSLAAKPDLEPRLANAEEAAIVDAPVLAETQDTASKADSLVKAANEVEEPLLKSGISKSERTPIEEASPDAGMSDISREKQSTLSTPASPLPKQSSIKTSTADSPSFKPDTPPKKDFRSALKSRQAPSGQTKDEGLEFQNAFGKLKRTQTQNYKAPDELRDNILRGKSGLSLTDGPQKTMRRDELKEDLTKQKEAMKAKAAQESPTKQPMRKESRSVTPEAIARRRALGNNESSGNILGSPVKSKSKIDDETVQPSIETSGVDESAKAVPNEPLAKPVSNKFADRFNPALASVLARGPAPRSPVPDVTMQPSAPTTTSMHRKLDSTKDDNGTGGLQHMTKARARGPKRRLPTTAEVTESSQAIESLVSATTNISRPSPLVKPRDLAQAAPETASLSVGTGSTDLSKPVAASMASDAANEADSTSSSLAVGSNEANRSPKASTSRSPPFPSRPSKPSGLRTSSAEVREPGKQLEGDEAPEMIPVKAETGQSTTNTHLKQSLGRLSKTPSQDEQVERKSKHVSQKSEDAPRMTVKSASAMWGKREGKQTSPREPIALPTRKDEDVARQLAGLDNAKLDPNLQPSVEASPIARTSKPQALAKAPAPPLSPKPSISTPTHTKSRIANGTSAPTPRSPSTSITPRSPNSQAAEAAKLFSDFFGERPVAPKELEVDTDTIINSGKESIPKIKTLRNHISEITKDGKTVPLSSGQEHVLYSSRMYVCTHIFGDQTGARISEVYLWSGSQITDSAVDDAQVLAKKVAKDNGAKLIVFRQGKETPNFFQALGGIIITRDGSARDSSSKYMLCCRQHLGHIAFDEVPFSPSSLCSGFAYIVAAGPDKVFLWKGSGCNTEELSVASLISMDISPARTEEVEGQESSQFLQIFPDSKPIPRSADHWKHKPKQDNYRARLYHVEWHDRPVSSHNSGAAQALWGMVRRQSQPAPTSLRIQEIAPFTQRDLESENIYVLDAFFEIYV